MILLHKLHEQNLRGKSVKSSIRESVDRNNRSFEQKCDEQEELDEMEQCSHLYVGFNVNKTYCGLREEMMEGALTDFFDIYHYATLSPYFLIEQWVS